MKQGLITISTDFTVEFYDVDSMQIVWHGNYVKYFEVGRCALLDEIAFGYPEMASSGYAWPVVDIRLKYIRPLQFRQQARVEATLLEYENRLRIAYAIYDRETGSLLTKGESIQMAVHVETMTSCFASPECLTSKVEQYLATGDR
ncbi:MAG TPA: thioesterase family protein [Treponemataceae bacterium]|nr:thioesterase family protein [Treponemataceae bacterium]